MKKLILLCVLLSLLSFLGAYSTYGAPSEFGNESLTTCQIGGDYGVVNCSGNISGNYYFGDGSYLSGIGGNSSFNQTLTDDLYVDISGDTITGDLNVLGEICYSPVGTGAFCSSAWADSYNKRIDSYGDGLEIQLSELGGVRSLILKTDENDFKFNSSGSLQLVNKENSSWNQVYANTIYSKLVGGNSINGQQDYNGGWTSGGLSIIDGDIYAQTGYFYNLTGINLETLNINSSILPQFDNVFNIGSSTKRYKDFYLSNDAFIGGDVGIGTISPNALLDIEDDNPRIRLTDTKNIGDWEVDEVLNGIDFYTSDVSGRGIGAQIEMINDMAGTAPRPTLRFLTTSVAGGAMVEDFRITGRTGDITMATSRGGLAIGKTDADEKLDVYGQAIIGTTYSLTSADADLHLNSLSDSVAALKMGSATYGWKWYYNSAGNLDLKREVNNVENSVMLIERATGDIGINQASPEYNLDIGGDFYAFEDSNWIKFDANSDYAFKIYSTVNKALDVDGDSQFKGNFLFLNDSNKIIKIQDAVGNGVDFLINGSKGTLGGEITLIGGYSQSDKAGDINLNGGSGSGGGDIILKGGEGTTLDGDVLMANNDGKVGINLLTPSYKLDIGGDFRATESANYIKFDGTSGDVFTVYSTAGSNALYVDGKSKFEEEIYFSNTSDQMIKIEDSTGTNDGVDFSIKGANGQTAGNVEIQAGNSGTYIGGDLILSAGYSPFPGKIKIGNSSFDQKITMYSPDGTDWDCGVSDAGVFACS